MIRWLLGGVLGGLIVFGWCWVSWKVLPWHHATFSTFQNEALFRELLIASTPEPGVYTLPGFKKMEGMSAEDKKLAKAQMHEQMVKGPFAFVVAQPKGLGPMKMRFLFGLGMELAVGLLITALLMWASLGSYWTRLGFVVLTAVTLAVVAYLPAWNWWGFPVPFTLVGMADIVIGWFLAGLVIAKVAE
jgi:hypothetical protein